jgi:hypothetical protein
MSCPIEPPAAPVQKRTEIWIEWGGKLPDGTPRTFGPYLNWDEAKQHGFKEPKD